MKKVFWRLMFIIFVVLNFYNRLFWRKLIIFYYLINIIKFYGCFVYFYIIYCILKEKGEVDIMVKIILFLCILFGVYVFIVFIDVF